MTAKKLIVLSCGHTTLDLELVLTGHPDPSVVRHLMPCVHEPGPDGKVAHPIYAYVIQHDKAQIMVDTAMSVSFSKDWKNNFYKEAMAYDPGADGLFTTQLSKIDMKPSDFTDLIITHLHTDHAGNLPMFAQNEKTRIIIHEDELRGCVTEKGGMLRDDMLTLWGVTSPQGFTRKDFACLLPNRATTVFADGFAAGSHLGDHGRCGQPATRRVDTPCFGSHLLVGELWRSVHGQYSQSGSAPVGTFRFESAPPRGEVRHACAARARQQNYPPCKNGRKGLRSGRSSVFLQLTRRPI
jgi:hypothetical protein